jgi:hypothetical protein
VLNRLFGLKRDEMVGGLIKLINEEHLNLYSPPNIIIIIKLRRTRWAGHEVCMGKKRNAFKIVMRKPERKRPLEKSRRRWEDNIKMHVRKTEWGGMDWIGMDQNREKWKVLMNMVMKLRLP